MAYLGRQLTSGNYLKLDDISSQFNGSTTRFNLTSGGNPYYAGSPFSILVSLGGVIQEPDSAYTIDVNQIVFAQAPQSTDDFFCVSLGEPLAIGVPGDGTVTGSKFAKPFNYDEGLLYLDDTSNRVGINTTLPTTALNVVGVVSATGGFNLGISSAGTSIASGPITTLNFIGLGNTFRVSGTTVDISIQGGSTGAGGTFSANAVGVHTTKLLGINTTTIAGAGNSEGAIQVVGNVALVDGAVLTDQNIDANVFIPSGKNGLLIGPVTVGLGITVDVASGSVLVIV